MTTWTLLVFLAYSGGDMGSVALDNSRVDFFSKAQCEAAKKAVDASFKEERFHRYSLVCVNREMPVEGGPFPEGGKKK